MRASISIIFKPTDPRSRSHTFESPDQQSNEFYPSPFYPKHAGRLFRLQRNSSCTHARGLFPAADVWVPVVLHVAVTVLHRSHAAAVCVPNGHFGSNIAVHLTRWAGF